MSVGKFFRHSTQTPSQTSQPFHQVYTHTHTHTHTYTHTYTYTHIDRTKNIKNKMNKCLCFIFIFVCLFFSLSPTTPTPTVTHCLLVIFPLLFLQSLKCAAVQRRAWLEKMIGVEVCVSMLHPNHCSEHLVEHKHALGLYQGHGPYGASTPTPPRFQALGQILWINRRLLNYHPKIQKDRRRRPPAKDPPECPSPLQKKQPIFFKKVFHGCPLKINCSTTWDHPTTKDHHLILGADEGIFTLNLNSSEATIELLFPGKCTWVYTISNVLMSISGKSSQLHSHSLKELYDQARKEHRIVALPTHRLLPRKFAISTKIPETKGCRACAVANNVQSGCVFLCGALESSVVLLQWYEPMHKFMLIKHFDFPLPNPLRVFEMVVVPEQEYPMVCIGVNRGQSPSQPVRMENINLNSNTSWFTNTGLEAQSAEKVQLNQLDSNTLLVLIENTVHMVNLEGAIKSHRKLHMEISFPLDVESVVYFDDTLLAIWKHGWQRRGEVLSEILQEITEPRKTFRLIGSDRLVVLETRQSEDQSGMCNLYILEIAENFVLIP
uniref:CNH domain-containing protein n=1 Tax=Astyanax mexicanus TaxID=7994 RepID=A0A3B1ISZ6_ASTMX